jgi:hypothetical protein
MIILSKKEINEICEKYDLKFSKDKDCNIYYLFIRSLLFTPNGWKRLFPEGYYNCFCRFHRTKDQKYTLIEQSTGPTIDIEEPNYYIFNRDNVVKSANKEEFNDWVRKTVYKVRVTIPKRVKERKLKQKLKRIKEDF